MIAIPKWVQVLFVVFVVVFYLMRTKKINKDVDKIIKEKPKDGIS